MVARFGFEALWFENPFDVVCLPWRCIAVALQVCRLRDVKLVYALLVEFKMCILQFC